MTKDTIGSAEQYSTLKKITYLPLDDEEQLDIVEADQSEILKNVNTSINQQIEYLISLYQKSNLDDIPLDRRKNIIKKLEET
ncbi:18474_t:CDS:2, partial [Racocetra fulgida]